MFAALAPIFSATLRTIQNIYIYKLHYSYDNTRDQLSEHDTAHQTKYTDQSNGLYEKNVHKPSMSSESRVIHSPWLDTNLDFLCGGYHLWKEWRRRRQKLQEEYKSMKGAHLLLLIF